MYLLKAKKALYESSLSYGCDHCSGEWWDEMRQKEKALKDSIHLLNQTIITENRSIEKGNIALLNSNDSIKSLSPQCFFVQTIRVDNYTANLLVINEKNQTSGIYIYMDDVKDNLEIWGKLDEKELADFELVVISLKKVK